MKFILNARLKYIFITTILVIILIYSFFLWFFQSQLAQNEKDDFKTFYAKDIEFEVEEEYDVDGQVENHEITNDKLTELEGFLFRVYMYYSFLCRWCVS